MTSLVADRLRVNELALEVPAWAVSAVNKVAEVPGYRGLPPGFADNAVVLAFGDELLVLPGNDCKWRAPCGREFAAACLLQLAEAVLWPELQQMAEVFEGARGSPVFPGENLVPRRLDVDKPDALVAIASCAHL